MHTSRRAGVWGWRKWSMNHLGYRLNSYKLLTAYVISVGVFMQRATTCLGVWMGAVRSMASFGYPLPGTYGG